MISSTFEDPLRQWIQVLGAEFVDCDLQSLHEAETATFATVQRVPAILRPADRQQVQECLRIANRFAVPVYPISSGKNWGYGSRVPPADGCALIDLRRLDRIVDFNEELAYVTVEPGVTQRQLYRFLQERGSRLWMDATGSSPDCSLIGNAMERGFGHTPYGDHFAHVCGLEVVLPYGEVIETGSARFSGSLTAATNRWGVGPSIDGLFSQSNFGIVTRMTIWLMREPESFEAFFFRSENPDGLASMIDSLRDLRVAGVLNSSIHIGNDYKVLGGLQQYPWSETGGKTPLSPDIMARFRKDLSFGYWNASGGLYGTPGQVRDAKQRLRRALSQQPGKLKFLSEKTLRLARRFSKPFRIATGWDLSRTVELVEPVLGLMRGVPTEQPLASAYWRKRFAPPPNPDPDRDRCGLLWHAPVAPASGRAAANLTNIVSEVLLEFGFEPMISLTLLTPRLVYSVVSITYDREVTGEDEKAMRCYEELVKQCSKGGYYAYRLGSHSMSQMGREDAYSDLLARFRKAADPQGVLAPGRYQSEVGAKEKSSHANA